ncbi:MAG: hypothetical protein C0601_01745 [Candidatus Muiribacterium halophilum]|uniref:Response regulatory domain-containing protein n=1 Tax=Muiribacterium halophilum TaxID=2053465 RepID=A0A2N5ZLA7_MUIH1|nr:MAG: hypothetical protein C0601_01745 [Candidatus Muirbacterium halophilum]
MFKDLNILVVDDEVDILNILEFYLKKKGAKVIRAMDAFQALEAMYDEKNSIDLILLDIMLPVLDGYQICKILKMQRDYNSIPIIMVSALGEMESMKKGFLVGADDYIVKPFTEKVVVEGIQKALEENKKLKSSGLEYNIKFELKSDFSYMHDINNMTKWIFSNTDAQEWVISDLMYSLNEMCTNAIEHGNKKDKNKNVYVECKVYKDRITISIMDEGTGFDPDATMDFLEDADIFRLRGRGLIITKKMMDEVSYEEDGKKVVLTKFFKPQDSKKEDNQEE